MQNIELKKEAITFIESRRSKKFYAEIHSYTKFTVGPNLSTENSQKKQTLFYFTLFVTASLFFIVSGRFKIFIHHQRMIYQFIGENLTSTKCVFATH